MTGPDPGAEIQDVRRWDPRLRQPPDQQQLSQVPGVGPVGLCSLLLTLQRGRLGRLSQVHLGADSLELLGHEPPTRRCLQRHLQPFTPELGQELPHADTVRWRDPRPEDLAGDRVDPLRRDLRAMLIKPHHDRHQTNPPSSTPPPAARRGAHPIPSSTVGTSYSNGRPRGWYPRAPSTYAVRRGGPATFTTPGVTRQTGHHIFVLRLTTGSPRQQQRRPATPPHRSSSRSI